MVPLDPPHGRAGKISSHSWQLPCPRSKHQLRVSSYDRVSSWIVALLIVTCVTVGALVIIYFTRKFIVARVRHAGDARRHRRRRHWAARDPPTAAELDPPGVEDAPRSTSRRCRIRSLPWPRPSPTAQPFLPMSRSTSNWSRRNDTATTALPAPAAAAAAESAAESAPASAPAAAAGRTAPRNPLRAGHLLEYAQWLDFFKIELGVLQQDENKVYYAYNLSQGKAGCSRWRPCQGTAAVHEPDRQPVRRPRPPIGPKAGIGDKGRIILQFYPPEAQEILYTLEQKQAGERKPETIRGTVFRVTRTGNKFEFSVIDQTYR